MQQLSAKRRTRVNLDNIAPINLASPINLLPLELLGHIFSYATPQDWLIWRRACYVWYRVVSAHDLWRDYQQSHYPDSASTSFTTRHHPNIIWQKQVLSQAFEHAQLTSLYNNSVSAALIEAAKCGNVSIMRRAIADKSTLNHIDQHGQTPLIIAAEQSHTTIVTLLLAQPDININHIDQDEMTALMWAAHNGHSPIVDLLIAMPTLDLNYAASGGSNALLLAVANNQLTVIQSLLTQPHLNINHTGANNRTALTLAAAKGYTPIVMTLLASAEININACDMNNETALMLAAKGGYHTVVAVLLTRSDLKLNQVETTQGLNALMYAIIADDVVSVKQLLAQPKLSINTINNNELTALMLAAERGQTTMVQALLERADINLINHVDELTWQTALMRAADHGHIGVVQWLLTARGIKICQVDRSGNTACMLAQTKGYTAIVALINQALAIQLTGTNTLGFFANAIPRPNDSNTPLQQAERNYQ